MNWNNNKLRRKKIYNVWYGQRIIKDSLDYGKDEKYYDLQDVVEDNGIYQKIEEYADKIRDMIK